MNVATAKKMLTGLDHPTTPARVNKRLESIAAGRGAHKPTAAHPYRQCFSAEMHVHRGTDRTFAGSHGGKRYDDLYGAVRTCVEYIADCEAAKLERAVA